MGRTNSLTKLGFLGPYFHLSLVQNCNRPKTPERKTPKSKDQEENEKHRNRKRIGKNVRSKQVPLVSDGNWSSHVSSPSFFCLSFFSNLSWNALIWLPLFFRNFWLSLMPICKSVFTNAWRRFYLMGHSFWVNSLNRFALLWK